MGGGWVCVCAVGQFFKFNGNFVGRSIFKIYVKLFAHTQNYYGSRSLIISKWNYLINDVLHSLTQDNIHFSIWKLSEQKFIYFFFILFLSMP